MPAELVFKSLADSLKQPLKSKEDSLINSDMRLFGRSDQLHVGLDALLQYFEKNKALPELNNEEQANIVVKLAVERNEERKKVIKTNYPVGRNFLC